MDERVTGSRSVENAAVGMLIGFAIVAAMLLLAFAILAGYSVGHDLQAREKATEPSIAKG